MLPTRVSLRICMVRRRAARRAIGLLPTPSALLGAGSWRSVRRMGRPPASGGRGEIKSVGQRPQNLAMSVIAMLRQLTALPCAVSLGDSAHQDVTILTDTTRSFVLALARLASPKSSSRPLRRSTP